MELVNKENEYEIDSAVFPVPPAMELAAVYPPELSEVIGLVGCVTPSAVVKLILLINNRLQSSPPGVEILVTTSLKYEYATELVNEIVVYCCSVYVCPEKLCISNHVEPSVLPRIVPSPTHLDNALSS